MKRHRIFKP